MVWISGGKEMEKDPSFQGSQRILSFPSTTSDSVGRSAGAEGWYVPGTRSVLGGCLCSRGSFPPAPVLITHTCNEPGFVCKHQEMPAF